MRPSMLTFSEAAQKKVLIALTIYLASLSYLGVKLLRDKAA